MRSLDRLDQWITTKVRAWSSRISGTPRSAELLEIRRDILNDVGNHIQPKSEGRSVFPYNTVSILIAAEDSSERAVLEQAFGDNELEQTVSALLSEAGCPLPAGLRVTVSVADEPGAAFAGRPFRVDYTNVKAAAGDAKRNSRPGAKLTVLRGQTDAAEYNIDSDRINLGRLKEVISDKEGLRRRNDVAFAETETTVSREHAFIRYDAETGQFQLYDSMSQRGTQVFRNGRRFEARKGPTHGFQLRSGDEIHLGDARVRFDIDAV